MSTPGPDHEAHVDRIVSEYLATGFSCTPSFITPTLMQLFRQEALSKWEEGDFSAAQIGQGGQKIRHTEIRSDYIHWIEPAGALEHMTSYLQFLDSLRRRINQEINLGLFEFEGHFAMYPPGSRYQKHLDCFHQLRRRLVSVILYLNENWSEADGGQLRIYTEGEREDVYTDYLPIGGSLVIFASDRYYHEVLPGTRKRLSLTGWLCRRQG